MHVFIINPTAGKGKGKKIVEDFLNDYPSLKKDCKTFYTAHEGHAKPLAEQIASIHAERMKQLVVVGGDGTFYEVLNGLKAFPNIPIAFVPVGSGNDIARGFGTSLNPKKNLRDLYSGLKKRPYWFGTYHTDLSAATKYNLFGSTIGFGFDAEIVERVNGSTFKKGLNALRLSFLIYIVGLILTLISFQPKSLDVTIDGKAYTLHNVYLMTFSNHPYFGGGMKIAPHAKNHQTDFAITIVRDISKLKLLLLCMTIFFGKHTKIKGVETLKGSNIKVQSAQELTFQADGFSGRCYRCSIQKEDRPRRVKRK